MAFFGAAFASEYGEDAMTRRLCGLGTIPMSEAQAGDLTNKGKKLFEEGNIKSAVELWEMAAHRSPEAKYNLAGAYAQSDEPQKIESVIKLCNEIISEGGNPCCGPAAFLLGQIYAYGMGGVPINQDQAGTYLEMAMERGHPLSAQKAFNLYVELTEEAAKAFDDKKTLGAYQRVLRFFQTAHKWAENYSLEDTGLLKRPFDEGLKVVRTKSKYDLLFWDKIRFSILVFKELLGV